MDIEDLRGELRRQVTMVLADSGIEVHFDALFEGIPAMETAAGAPIVQLAEQLTGHAPEAVAFATEAPYLQQLGMDTIVLGPGDIGQAHQPDEYIALERLQPTVDLLRRMIGSVCVDTGRLL
jgi:acetylornithine deacetylase